jgi:hypothetical protein
MKIAIFSISLGKYDIFFKDFYESVNENFLPDHEKTFYLFTDKIFEQKDNLIQIETKKQGWPYDSMLRFHYLQSIKEQILENDYVFFFNINMKALSPIKEEVLPKEKNDYLVGCDHPLHHDWDPKFLPYERNKEISCSIDITEGKKYYQGCFNGGRTKEFMEMCDTLCKNIDFDLSKNLIPIWHDESYLNWYFKSKEPLLLPYTYIYPEDMKLPGIPIMIQRNKWKYMDKEKLRS